jgi:6-phosphogluconolactonase
MIRVILLPIYSLMMMSGLFAQSVPARHIGLLVGSYTGPADSTGISWYEFDTTSGNLTLQSKIYGIENASYLLISKNSKKVYAASEKNKGTGSIYAFGVDKVNHHLSFINNVPSGGDGPCYVETDKEGKYVFAANYGSGTLSAVKVNSSDGSLNPEIQILTQPGGSINKENQGKPHAHSVVVSPDNHFVLAANLGNDKIYSYRIDTTAQTILAPCTPAFLKVHPGSGPRHITFHPNGKTVYVVNELDGSVDVFGYLKARLTFVQRVSLIPAGYKGVIEAADIHISPDARFLYASNREQMNDLSIFRIQSSGKLSLVGHQSVLGKAPRNFAIDPTGKFLLVANMNSDEIVVFSRDILNGNLKDTHLRMAVNKPACIKFFPAN